MALANALPEAAAAGAAASTTTDTVVAAGASSTDTVATVTTVATTVASSDGGLFTYWGDSWKLSASSSTAVSLCSGFDSSSIGDPSQGDRAGKEASYG